MQWMTRVSRAFLSPLLCPLHGRQGACHRVSREKEVLKTHPGPQPDLSPEEVPASHFAVEECDLPKGFKVILSAWASS